jgi:hypothetical protein
MQPVFELETEACQLGSMALRMLKSARYDGKGFEKT